MSEEEIKKPLTKEELSLIRELVYAEKVFDMSFQNIAKKLLNEVDLKETQLQQKEKIIKEVREKIRYWQQDYMETYISTDELDEILEILSKVD